MASAIDELLESYNATDLFAMGREAGVFAKSTKPPRDQIVERMRAAFFTPERIRASLVKLNPLEQKVLNRLLLNGGDVQKQGFERELRKAGLTTMPPSAQPTGRWGQVATCSYAPGEKLASVLDRKSIEFQDVLARLTLFGLVFSRHPGGEVSYKLGLHPGDILHVPSFVRGHLPEPTPVQESVTVAWAPARVQHGNPLLFLRDLYLYWDFVRQNDIPLLQSGLVGKRTIRALNQTLLAPDLAAENGEQNGARLYTLRQFLQQLKLLAATAGRLTVTLKSGSEIPGFWLLTQEQQLAEVSRCWLRMENPTELAPDGQYFLLQLGHARRLLLGVLLLKPMQWFDAADLLDELRTRDKNFLIRNRAELLKQRSYYGMSIGPHYYGNLAQVVNKLDALEDTLLRSAVDRFLLPLGLVEVGYTAEATALWQGLRLTALGVAALTQVAAEDKFAIAAPSRTYAAQPPPDPGKVVVQPNFQILAIGPTPLGVLAELDLFAERRKVDPGVFEYQLTRESVYRGRQAGVEIGQIVAFLRTQTGAELPQNVGRSLQEWGAHHERFIFRQDVTLLQAADGALLQQLLEQPQVGKHLTPVTGAPVAMVKGHHGDKVLAALLNRGLLPAVAGDQPASADNGIIVEPDGRIRVLHAVPSIYLAGRLAQVTEQDSAGLWRVTERVVRRVGGSREKILALLAELERLHRGELPATLIGQVKRWGGYYGRADAETVTLLEFGDPAGLRELREDPRLAPLLTPFKAGERTLVAVETEQLPQVVEILLEYGLPLGHRVRRG